MVRVKIGIIYDFDIKFTILILGDINSRLQQPSAPVIPPVNHAPVNHIHVRPVDEDQGT